MADDSVKRLAAKLLAEVNKNTPEIPISKYGFIDPITIIICISILVNVIRVIQECNKNKTSALSYGDSIQFLHEDIKFRAVNNNFFSRMKLKSIIKKQLNREQYKKYGDPLLKSLLAVGKDSTEEEVSSLVEYK